MSWRSSFERRPQDATDAEMARRSVDGLRHARRRPVTPTVVGRAEERAALRNLAGDEGVWHARIEALLAHAAARVPVRAAATTSRPVARLVEVHGPFPHVAGHLVESV